MLKKKNRAAQALARKRWKDVPKDARSEQMRAVVKVRWDKKRQGQKLS